MGDFAWRPLVKQARLRHHPLSPLLLEKVVNMLLRLALLSVLLRLPPMPLPLFWPRGNKMTVLGFRP